MTIPVARDVRYTPRDVTDFIAVHCSATRVDQNIDADVIRDWHTKKGWIDIGYHLVIPRNGLIQLGRPLWAIGAHVEGYNNRSLGICLAGGLDSTGKAERNFTDVQYGALLVALRFCRNVYPAAHIQGHRDFPNVQKDCPCFNVREWLETAVL